MIGPDATLTFDFALSRLADVIEKLLVYPENMEKNLNKLRGRRFPRRRLLQPAAQNDMNCLADY
ncbi:adenylosuccinate lyase [Rhizobium esperanzae]|uniref:Adenylosuccinate lyase n=1 Tax=Rhizobium esperanzae TaxID=1967781 RepID=A0A7W6R6A5_9HYPH|nr:adenylosuccinate lyase [Rhizobium esperanzae]